MPYLSTSVTTHCRERLALHCMRCLCLLSGFRFKCVSELVTEVVYCPELAKLVCLAALVQASGSGERNLLVLLLLFSRL
eukprot:3893010-Amphidinium_carterae.2